MSVLKTILDLRVRQGTLLNQYIYDFASRADGSLPTSFIASSFNVSGGHAVNTPLLGQEIALNPSFENWIDVNTPANWEKYQAGASTVTREDVHVHSGTYAAKLSSDASNSQVYIIKGDAFTVGELYSVSYWAKCSAGANYLRIVSGPKTRNVGVSDVYQKHTLTFHADVPYIAFQIGEPNTTIYIDDISIKKISAKNTVALMSGDVNTLVTSNLISLKKHNCGGVAACVDNPELVNNGLFAYTDGVGMFLYKLVSGAWTQLINVAMPFYQDEFSISIVKNGTSVALFYGGVQMGATITVNDPTIINNHYHGLFAASELTVSAKFIKSKIPTSGEVMLTFDDAYTSVYSEAYTYMKNKIGAGTVYVITNAIGTANHATAEQLLAMQTDGWDIANHTHTHTLLTTLNQAQVETELTTAKNTLNSLGLTSASNHVAYPGGYVNDAVRLAMQSTQMLTGRGTENPESFVLKNSEFDYIQDIPSVYMIDNLSDINTIKAFVNHAIANGLLAVFYIHDVVEVATTPNHMTITLFRELVDWLQSMNIRNIKITELYEKLRP